MGKLTRELFLEHVREALEDNRKAQKAKGGGRSALAAFTDRFRRKPRLDLARLARGQSDTTR